MIEGLVNGGNGACHAQQLKQERAIPEAVATVATADVQQSRGVEQGVIPGQLVRAVLVAGRHGLGDRGWPAQGRRVGGWLAGSPGDSDPCR